MGVPNLPFVVALVLLVLGQGSSSSLADLLATLESPTVLPTSAPPSYRGCCTLPPEIDVLLRTGVLDQRGLDEAMREYRTRRPELYRESPPPWIEPRLPGEFEPAEALYLSYLAWDEYAELYGDVIEAASSQGEVRLLTSPAERASAEALIRSRGVDGSRVTLIDEVAFESAWIRDYGPIPVEITDGLAFVDGAYFLNCPHDDAVPTRLAAVEGIPRVLRHGLRLEGGNLLSNGRGLCLTTTGLPAMNGLGEEEAAEFLRRYYGCRQTAFLLPLAGPVVDHVDMYAAFASEDLVLIGEYEVEQDGLNQAILDLNARALEGLQLPDGRRLGVVRVPMPDWREAPAGSVPPAVFRTYLNLVVFNGVVLVPVYDSDRGTEVRALGVLAEAFPGREVVPIPADQAAEDGGGVHCLARTLPRVGPPRAGVP